MVVVVVLLLVFGKSGGVLAVVGVILTVWVVLVLWYGYVFGRMFV